MISFSSGFNELEKEKEKQKERIENLKNKLWKFFLAKDGDSADILFLHNDPVNTYYHSVRKFINGKEIYEDIPCLGSNCPHCLDGNQPSFKSAWLVVDFRPYEKKGKSGTETVDKQLKMFLYGIKVSSLVQRKAERYGLTDKIYIMERIGKGQNTSYLIENGDDFKLSHDEISDMLPEGVRDIYNGTEESLKEVLKEQIMAIADTDKKEDVEEEEDYEEEIVPLKSERKPFKLRKKNPVEDSKRNVPSIKKILKNKRGK